MIVLNYSLEDSIYEVLKINNLKEKKEITFFGFSIRYEEFENLFSNLEEFNDLKLENKKFKKSLIACFSLQTSNGLIIDKIENLISNYPFTKFYELLTQFIDYLLLTTPLPFLLQYHEDITSHDQWRSDLMSYMFNIEF